MKLWLHFIVVLFWVFPFCGLTGSVSAQTCLHTDLSKKFDYRVVCKYADSKDVEIYKDAIVDVFIIDKKSKKLIQHISLKADLFFNTAYKNCEECRSYLTSKNKNKKVEDYDFGDFIVADLNFDGLEDIAVKYDSGGNGGPFYNFYLQNKNNRFELDHFLTDSVGSFPQYIDLKHKTLTTQIHANVYQESKKSFRYTPIGKKWKLVKWVMIGS